MFAGLTGLQNTPLFYGDKEGEVYSVVQTCLSTVFYANTLASTKTVAITHLDFYVTLVTCLFWVSVEVGLHPHSQATSIRSRS